MKTYCFAEFDYSFLYRNDFISPVIDRPRKLVSDVYTEPAALVQYPEALLPDKVQVIDIVFVSVVEPNLAAVTVVLQLPIRGRCDDEMDALILEIPHPPAVADDGCGFGRYIFPLCLNSHVSFRTCHNIHTA